MKNTEWNTNPHGTSEENDETQDLLRLFAEIAFSDPSPEVRSEAQRSLKELFEGGEQGFDDLVSRFVEGLKDTTDERKRTVATMSLIALGEIATPYVRPLLRDSDPEIRHLAVKILTRIESEQMAITPSRTTEDMGSSQEFVAAPRQPPRSGQRCETCGAFAPTRHVAFRKKHQHCGQAF